MTLCGRHSCCEVVIPEEDEEVSDSLVCPTYLWITLWEFNYISECSNSTRKRLRDFQVLCRLFPACWVFECAPSALELQRNVILSKSQIVRDRLFSLSLSLGPTHTSWEKRFRNSLDILLWCCLAVASGLQTADEKDDNNVGAAKSVTSKEEKN